MPSRPSIETLERRELFSTLPAGFSETTVADIDTNVSATMAFTPDGRLFVGDTTNGKIRVVKNGALLTDAALALSVDRAFERGINGIAIAPNFATAAAGQKYVFVYYTRPDSAKPNQSPSNAKNRLSRFAISAANADKLDPASETVIVDNISATAGNHNGGALHFGADGMLYLGVGEAAVRDDAQKLSTYNGKILRINAMSTSGNYVPADNPFVSTAGALPLIWARGFRNPFTGAIKPGTSTLFINDVGQSSWEEINVVKKGLNYGWPIREGNDGGDPNFEDPLFTYANTGGFAITGGAFYNGSNFPTSYAGKYFFGDFGQKRIWWLDEATKQRTQFASNTLQVVDIDLNPTDGSLYYLGLDGRVQRIRFSTGNRAPTAVATANKTTGLKPLTVTFDGSGSSDPDGDTLTYTWNFGDGTTATGKTVTHTYSADGKFNAVLTVNDGKGGSDPSNAIVITVGNTAPVPKISSPIANALYNGGQAFTFTGSATDAQDGTLGASKFAWDIRLHHNTHNHPFKTATGVTSGTFVVPKVGEVDANQFYRITLTVTDSAGVKSSTSVDIKPRKSTFTLKTSVAGLKLSLDSAAAQAAPFSTIGVVGMTRKLSAPATQTLDGKTYEFVSWSDGKSATHDVDIATTNVTYTANYRQVTSKTLRATADATVRDGSFSSQNFGAAVTIDVKKNNTGFNRQAYLKFDLAGVASVSSAKLRFYGKLDNSQAKNIPLEIFSVSSTTWTENGITWNNKPATGTTVIGKFTVTDTTARYYEVDISSYVKSQRAAGKSVIAIALKSALSATPLAVFNSDENAANKPQLVVTTPVATAATQPASEIVAASAASLWWSLRVDEQPGPT
jgi:glucose/arabinose dehydrogenase